VFAGDANKFAGISPATSDEAVMTISLVHTIPEACSGAKIGRTALYEAIRSGALRAVKRGRRTLILDEDLRRWVRSLPSLEAKPAANVPGRDGGSRGEEPLPARRSNHTIGRSKVSSQTGITAAVTPLHPGQRMVPTVAAEASTAADPERFLKNILACPATLMPPVASTCTSTGTPRVALRRSKGDAPCRKQ